MATPWLHSEGRHPYSITSQIWVLYPKKLVQYYPPNLCSTSVIRKTGFWHPKVTTHHQQLPIDNEFMILALLGIPVAISHPKKNQR
jgi:hypothetical protein